jgi:mannose-6-phosphate isomerase-like protein (cupin superfamily)
MTVETKQLQSAPDATAPDGSDVRVLLHLDGGGVAHFELAPGRISKAVTHRTVEEIWYILRGQGQMWRKLADREETVDLRAGLCLTIPLGTHFQFRSFGYEPLSAVGVTMPPWPGEDEAIIVEGPWEPTVA